ncbi:MAG: helix-turn-helix domain-containing protein [Propionibacteriaceae bacterium]|jgi:DNA-binding XRE family transcriptional regulator|nr:helix-turn-helix domain-containing protein [Propionibacteriaceae bacterium]
MSRIDELVERRAQASPAFADAYKQEAERLRVAAALAALRAEAGLTQRELAELSGKPQSTIARIENGSMSPSLRVLTEIAASVGKRVELRFVSA